MRLLPDNIHTFKGSILLDGRELMGLTDKEIRSQIRWRQVSMVFQGAMNSLNPVTRVGHQIVEPLRLLEKMGKEEARERGIAKMAQTGLADEVYEMYPHELSGGMKQRVIIAMALIMDPKLVILDEPTSALDVSVQAQIMNLLKDLKKQEGLSYLFISHDIALTSDLCDRFAVMYAGRIAETGSAEQVLQNPEHPYTQKLLASAPRLRSDVTPEFIPGAPPDMVNPPAGCRFHPRCPYVMDICRTREPELFPTGDGQFAHCWLHGDEHG